MKVTVDSTAVDSGQSDDSLDQLSGPSLLSVEFPSSVELASVSERDSDDASETAPKRQRLNLWKCKQCRDERKKCFPSGRIWSQKCDRCLSHKPEPLECSEPELNTRKRGPNRKGAELLSESQSTSDRLGPRLQQDGDSSSDDSSTWKRPRRTPVETKRESSRKINQEVASKQDYRPDSCYQPLGEGEFRLLKLEPGGRDDTHVYCSLITASMAQPMKYEAVSYLWGATGQKSMQINVVDSVGKAHPIYIRSHLFDALRSLRHPTIHRHFWVDALCINYGSSDSVEKNTQTSMKRYIFQNAENLCFWIGEDENYKKALNFIPKMLDITNINKLVRDGHAIDGWVSFVALLQNPVFSRLWLVQEVAISRNVTLHSGVTAIHYADLADAVAIFRSFREVSTNSLRTITYVEPGISEWRQNTEQLLSLEELVSYLSQLKATNPLDQIYSVLAIAKDGPGLMEPSPMDGAHETQGNYALKINYEANVLDVYQHFVLRAIENSQSLDIVCRKWADSVSDCNLPTWIRLIECFLPQCSDILDRTDADSLVGLPDHNLYNASKGTLPTLSVSSPQSSESPRSLFVRGLHIDTISDLGPRAEDGIILREWLELAQCDITQKEVPEAFWRTLVADRDPHGTFAPSWYRIAFLYCLLHSPTGNINTNRLIAESEAEPSLIVDFLQRVQSVIWNRKFLVSKNRNYFGLAPTVAQVGDFICILFGCTVPVVLRRYEDETGVVYFQLVGESYVHRIMDGEALAAGYPEKEFELR